MRATTRHSSAPKLAVIAVLGGILLTGCSGEATTGTITTTTAPSPSTSPSAAPARTAAGLGTGFVDGPATTDGLGNYIQLTLGPDSPLLQYTPSLVDTSATGAYSQEEITAAQGVAARFAISEGLDSTIAFNATTEMKQAWLDANSAKFTDVVRLSVVERIAGTDAISVVSSNAGLDDNGAKWRRGLSTYGGGSRFVGLSARLVSVTTTLIAKPGLSFHFSGVAKLPVKSWDPAETKAYLERETFDMTYITAQQADGTWLIDGWNNKFYSAVD